LPFEKQYFKDRWNWDVDYIGHPLMQVLASQHDLPHPITEIAGEKIIALLPGSRKQEINKMLTEMLSVVKDFPDYQFVIAGAPGQTRAFYEPFFVNKNVGFVQNQTYHLLQFSQAALVTSGTATLETALFKVPEVVLYKGNWVSYQIAKRLIKVKYIGLVNLIMDKEVVKELIQHELTTKNLINALEEIIKGGSKRERIENDYGALKALLKGGGRASEQAAKEIQHFLGSFPKK
jgi:lipid-A-disaccharide synthase